MQPPPKYEERGPLKRVWQALNKLREYSLSITPVSGANVRVQRTTRGAVIESNAKSETVPAEETTSGGMTFRGEFDSSGATQYSAQNVVVIRGGVSAGCYVCITDDPPAGSTVPSDPATGERWIMLAPGHTIGFWT